MYGNHRKKIGQHFPYIMSILHLTYFQFNEIYHLLYKQTSDQFCLAHLWGKDPLPLSFPISWYCKLDTGMQKPKLHPELFMKPKRFQSDLLLRPANFTSLVPTWHGAQPRRTRKPEMVHLISPPLQFTKQQPKVGIDLDPGTTQPEGNFTPLQWQLLSEICENVYGRRYKRVR